MRGVVIGGVGHLVGRGLQAVAGAESEPLRDVDFAAHSDAVGDTLLLADGDVLHNIVIVVFIQGGHSVILKFILGGDECPFGNEE